MEAENMPDQNTEFSKLVRETKASVLSAISRTLNPDYAHMIDDIVQETYIRAYNSLKKNKFRFESSINTWLYTIAKNESLRLNAKLNKQKNIEKELDESLIRTQQTPYGIANQYGDHDHTDISGKLDLVNKIIHQLPTKYKNVMELDILGLKDWQIAEKLKISLGTVKSRNSRAREKIRQWVHQTKLT